MRSRLLTLFMFWAVCSISHSANVNFTNMRLTWDQIDPNNGRTMLQLHYTLIVTGLQGHTLVPVMAVEIPQGTFHHFADGGEMKIEGNQLLCNFPSTTFNNQWQAVYVDALNPLPGKHTYYACIYLVDMTLGRQISQSNYFTFTNTGEQQQTQQRPKVQQQTQQGKQKKRASNHLMFQGIPMGQSGASIKAALKQKGFRDGEHAMTGTISGMPVEIWVADEGDRITVTERKEYSKAAAKQRYEVLKRSLCTENSGYLLDRGDYVDFGEGVTIANDKGFIELMYHNDDEMGGGSATTYTIFYMLKDKASMSHGEIAVESSYIEGDAISAETAISIYGINDEYTASLIMSHIGYNQITKDSKGYTYWCRNCNLTKTLKPTAFGKGTSSVVRYRFKGQPDVRVQVFNEDATQKYYDQLERLGYGWQGTGSGTGALEWKKDMTDQNEKSFWLISEKGYFYQQLGGYFLILGGNIE